MLDLVVVDGDVALFRLNISYPNGFRKAAGLSMILSRNP